MSDNIIITNDLTKRYGDKNAADKICIHVKKGEIYGLIGRNGAGKTTILKMLSGLSTPTEGSYSILGKTGRELNAIRSKVGALIENPGLYPNMSAYENLKLKCIVMDRNEDEYINELLSLVGLQHTGKKPLKGFSMGMKQRLGIALALIGDPEIIILDEPINGLDPQGIAEMRDILTMLSKDKGLTIIISSHILEELAKIADAYGIIHNGKLLVEMTAEELEEKCGEYTVLKTDNNIKTADILKKFSITDFSQIDDETIHIRVKMNNKGKIIQELVTSGVDIREIAEKHITLEQYYLDLTGGRNND